MMPTSESVLQVNYSDEITSNLEWYKLTQTATDILEDKILKDGGIAPAVLADWSIDKTAHCGHPTFVLRLDDIPNDPKGVTTRFSEELMRQDGQLGGVLRGMWGTLLDQRSRRLANEINQYIRGSMSGSQGGK
jgi:hypothetical protein